MKKNSGFTLVELSIVMVIIGLIVGAILAGQALITSAKIQNDINQLTKNDAAVNTFMLKYSRIPGWISNASTIIGPGAANGFDSNEFYVQGFFPFDAGPGFIFWNHLNIAGLSNFRPTGNTAAVDNAPGRGFMGLKALGGIAPYKSELTGNSPNGLNNPLMGDGNRYWRVGFRANTPFQEFAGNEVQSLIALWVDSKLDDGRPQTGTVRAACSNFWDNGPDYAALPGIGCNPGVFCVNASSEYTTLPNGLCGMRIRAGF